MSYKYKTCTELTLMHVETAFWEIMQYIDFLKLQYFQELLTG